MRREITSEDCAYNLIESEQRMQQLFTWGGNDPLLAELLRCGVRFLVIGGFAVKFYLPEREVDDLDLLIEQTIENADRLFEALAALHLTPNFTRDVISTPGKRHLPLKWIQYDYYADLVTEGEIDFPCEWAQSREALINWHRVRIASRALLIAMKGGSNRDRDLRDVALLEHS